MTDNKSEVIAKMKDKLDVLDARIAELEAKGGEAAGDARRDLESKLVLIREKKREAQRRLDELRLASKPAWEDVKVGAEQAWKSLASAVERAGERFR